MGYKNVVRNITRGKLPGGRFLHLTDCCHVLRWPSLRITWRISWQEAYSCDEFGAHLTDFDPIVTRRELIHQFQRFMRLIWLGLKLKKRKRKSFHLINLNKMSDV